MELTDAALGKWLRAMLDAGLVRVELLHYGHWKEGPAPGRAREWLQSFDHETMRAGFFRVVIGDTPDTCLMAARRTCAAEAVMGARQGEAKARERLRAAYAFEPEPVD